MKRETYLQTSLISHHPGILNLTNCNLRLHYILFTISILLAFQILLPGRVFANEQPREKRIMIRLVQEAKSNDCAPFCKDNVIGNTEIDALHKQVQVNKIRKMVAGRNAGKHIYVIELGENENVEDVIEKYKKTGQVIHAEPDHLGYGGGEQMLALPLNTPNDEFFNRQWSLHNDGTFSLSPTVAGSDIKMLAAWEIETGDPDLIIAILDSGINTNENDIKERLWRNPGEQIDGQTVNNGTDDDENGYIDDHLGWDFANNDNGLADDNGHGSNIAGIVGAHANNDIGYTGINWNSKIMALKALDSNLSGWYSWWIDAIYYAVDNGADIINISMGGDTDSEFLKEAVDYALEKGVPIVACMMNENNDVSYYPAAYPGVIAVGSTNPDDTRSSPFFWSETSGSNYGQHISVSAPGNFIYSISNIVSNYNIYWGGTSMAAPHVTGVASLMLSLNPNLSPADIKHMIEMSADDMVGDPTEDVEGWDQFYGHGRLNAHNALLLAGTSVDVKNPITPEVRLFPNPTSEFLHIVTTEPNSHLQILDITGKVVHQQILPTSNETIDVTGFKSGIYLIRVRHENQYITKRWVKS